MRNRNRWDDRSETVIREQMCEVGRRIWQKSFCAGNEGNHSVRVGEDRFLCTPTGISKGFLEPADICVVDAEGEMLETNRKGRKRTSEVKVHLAIYKKREDVTAVIHSHPPHATTFAVAGIPLPEGVHPEAEVFLGKVKTAQYATPSKQALPDSLTPLIGPETNSLLMGNHGSVSFSTSLIDAYYKLEILDAYCRILLLSRQLGRMNTLAPEQMKELLEVKKQFGLTDERLACVDQGCVGEQNQPFLAMFEDRPASASCQCNGGQVDHHDAASQAGRPESGPTDHAGADGLSEENLEALVQTITDQIMASASRN